MGFSALVVKLSFLWVFFSVSFSFFQRLNQLVSWNFAHLLFCGCWHYEVCQMKLASWYTEITVNQSCVDILHCRCGWFLGSQWTAVWSLNLMNGATTMTACEFTAESVAELLMACHLHCLHNLLIILDICPRYLLQTIAFRHIPNRHPPLCMAKPIVM